MIISSLKEAEEMHVFAPEINRLELGGSGIGLFYYLEDRLKIKKNPAFIFGA